MIYQNKKNRKNSVTDEMQQKMAYFYLNERKSTKEINKLLNLSNSAYYLFKLGIKLRDPSTAQRKYKFNKDIFDNINEQSAYWIGFIMADGNIYKNQLILALKDKDHLIKFKSFLGATHKIKYQSTGTHRIVITSKEIVKKLLEYGVTPRKSFTAKVIGALEYNRHFWRGMVDGDGCISIIKSNGKIYPNIHLIGSYESCRQFRDFVEPLVQKYQNVRTASNVYQIAFAGNPAYKIIKELYENSYIFLTRKKKIANRIINLVENKKILRGSKGENNGFAKFTEKQILLIRELRNRYKYKLKELAQIFKTHETYIYLIVTGKRWGHIKSSRKNN